MKKNYFKNLAHLHYIHPITRNAITQKEYFDFVFSKEYEQVIKRDFLKIK